MAVGNPKTLVDWNSRAGNLAVQLREILRGVQNFYQSLNATPDADLLAQGFAQGDINILRSAVTDANDLAIIFNNGTSAYLTGTHDYTAFIKQLYGVV